MRSNLFYIKNFPHVIPSARSPLTALHLLQRPATVAPVLGVHLSRRAPLDDLTDIPMSDLDSEADSEASAVVGSRKIPKPPGEVGRPGRGGYALSRVLSWDKDTLKKFKVGVLELDASRG